MLEALGLLAQNIVFETEKAGSFSNMSRFRLILPNPEGSKPVVGGVAPLNRPATSYDASGIKKNSGQEAFSFLRNVTLMGQEF